MPALYGRKNGGKWHRVSTDATHRAHCNQRNQATTTSTERPTANLCGQCFKTAQDTTAAQDSKHLEELWTENDRKHQATTDEGAARMDSKPDEWQPRAATKAETAKHLADNEARRMDTAADPAWMKNQIYVVEARPHHDAPHDGATLTHWTYHAKQITDARMRKHHKDRGVKFYGYREAEAEASRANRSQEA